MRGTRIFILLFMLLLPLATAIDYAPNNALNPTGSPVDTAIIPSDDPVWNYESRGLYDAHFLEDSASGPIVRFESGGAYINLQPMAMNWRNDLNQLEQVSMVQSVNGMPSANVMRYLNAYGAGTHLEYVAEETVLKENIILDSPLTEPAQYIIDGGNPALETNFIFGTNAFTIEIDGEQWDKKTATPTSSEVLIKNEQGETLYKLPPPIAIDADGDTITGTYEFKKSGVSLYISHHTPKSWLDNAAYPVIIDPTFQVDYTPIPGQLLEDADVFVDPDTAFNVTTVTTEVSDDDDLTFITTDRHTNHYDASINYTDEVWDGVNTINTLDIGAVDFNVGNADEIINVTACFFVSTKKAGLNDWNVTNGLTTIATIPLLPVGTTPTTWTCIDLNPSDFTDGVNRIGLRPINAGTLTLHMSYDTSASNGTSYWWASPIGPWTNAPLQDYGIKLLITKVDYDTGVAFSGHWSQTYDPTYTWFLKLRKLTIGTSQATVFAYSDSANITPSQNVTQSLGGIGWFYIPVDDLIIYEQNNTLMNYTHLRFTTFEPTNISEFRLMAEANDTGPPSIQNCTVDNVLITCNETARFSCVVTDDKGVANVTFTIDGFDYLAMEDFNDTWYVDLSPTGNYTATFTMTNASATDIFGQTNTTAQNVNTFYNCSPTPPPVQNTTMACLYNPRPFTTEQQDFICDITDAQNKTFFCYGITKHPSDGSIFDIKPRQELVDLYGATTGYAATPPLAYDQMVKVSFSTKRLTSTQPTVYQALCINDNDPDDTLQYNVTLTPRHETPNIIGEVAVSGAREGAPYYVMLLAALFIGLVVLFMIIRELRRR